jgi:hypothetical protein
MTVLRAILDPPFLDAMRGRGERTTDEASRLIADVVVPWFVDRAARARANRSPVERRRHPVAEHGRRSGGRP